MLLGRLGVRHSFTLDSGIIEGPPQLADDVGAVLAVWEVVRVDVLGAQCLSEEGHPVSGGHVVSSWSLFCVFGGVVARAFNQPR